MQLLHKFEEGFSVYFTTRDDGDARSLILNGSVEAELSLIRGDEIRLEMLNQVHSSNVHRVDTGSAPVGLIDGDALVSLDGNVALGVLVADCAPVALVSSEGVFAAVHAGWRGVDLGILGQSVNEMRRAGASSIKAYVGPSIKSECYEFGEVELSGFEQRLGTSVRSRAVSGAQSLDLLAAVQVCLRNAQVNEIVASSDCTACGEDYFSYRSKRSAERHLMVVLPENPTNE